jgi:hypothetical protein
MIFNALPLVVFSKNQICALIGHDLHESNPRCIVSADMDVLPTDVGGD